ncbi:MAG TPA: FAD synthetase family protein [Bacteroidales bacterium]|nr:FAD synthetase family protein [Bacteroidales bacterium]HRZ48221.1 FAD synthetase family protein [Bacteroidales bacterium]
MKVHYGLEEDLGIARSVVTTGTFDGVHIGHQVIIRRINELAREVGGESVLITFHPHPRKVLYPDTLGKDIRMINTQREKIAMLETTGLNHLVIMPFTREFAHTSSDTFIREILVRKLKIRKSVVGFNHFFGFNKEGNYEQLHTLGLELGFDVEEIPEQDIQNETVSSTKIRKAIEGGNIQRANAYLNHILMMMGKLRKEDTGFSRSAGKETFILPAEEEEKLLPPAGTYALRIRQEGVNAKCLGIRRSSSHDDKNLVVIPVEPVGVMQGPATLQFYKQLSQIEEGQDLSAEIAGALALADELIY